MGELGQVFHMETILFKLSERSRCTKPHQIQSVKLIIHCNRIPRVIPVFQDSHTLLFVELLVLMGAHKEEEKKWWWVVWVVSDLSVLLDAKKIFYFNNYQGVSESFFAWSNNDVVKHFKSDLPRSLGGEIFCVIQHLQCSLVRKPEVAPKPG